MAKRKPKEPTKPVIDVYVKEYEQYIKDLEQYIKDQMNLLEEAKKYIINYKKEQGIN